jgi:hypothetical protein
MSETSEKEYLYNRFIFFGESDPFKNSFFEKNVSSKLHEKQININFGDKLPKTHIEHKVFKFLTNKIKRSDEPFQSIIEKMSDLIERAKVIAFCSVLIRESDTNDKQMNIDLKMDPYDSIRHRIDYSVTESENHSYPVFKGTLLYDNIFGRSDRTKLSYYSSFYDAYKFKCMRMKVNFPLVFDNKGQMSFSLSKESRRLGSNITSKSIPME